MSVFDRLSRKKLRNGVKRSDTVRDVGRTETFKMNKINGLKRSQNHVYSKFTYTLQKELLNLFNSKTRIKLLLENNQFESPYDTVFLLITKRDRGVHERHQKNARQ